MHLQLVITQRVKSGGSAVQMSQAYTTCDAILVLHPNLVPRPLPNLLVTCSTKRLVKGLRMRLSVPLSYILQVIKNQRYRHSWNRATNSILHSWSLIVSVPDQNQPQCGLLSVSMLDTGSGNETSLCRLTRGGND